MLFEDLIRYFIASSPSQTQHNMLFNPVLFAIFRLPTILVCLWSFHQQFEVAAALAKRLRRSKLRVLRLVGLAFFIAHHIHLVLLVGQRIAYQKGWIEEKSKNLDVAEHYPQSGHLGYVQILRLLRHWVRAVVPHLHGRPFVEGVTSSRHLVLHLSNLILFNRRLPRKDRADERHQCIFCLYLVLSAVGGWAHWASDEPLAAVFEEARVWLRHKCWRNETDTVGPVQEDLGGRQLRKWCERYVFLVHANGDARRPICF